MDNVDRYLDQVCRGIAGPRSLRQHIRQELAEHLRDAAAAHRAAGMSEAEALARALEDFGGPEQVRAELEATHGHRLLTVVLDKALHWKERTMKVRWLWSTMAHAMLLLTLVVELMFICGCVIFIVPKFRELARVGWLADSAPFSAGPINAWSMSVIVYVESACQHWIWAALLAAATWVLFEWRVRSENKTLMRLSALGMAALGLGVTAFLTAAALILPLILLASSPVVHITAASRVAAVHTVKLDQSLKSLDEAIAANDWDLKRRHVQVAAQEFVRVIRTGVGQPLWGAPTEPGEIDAQFRGVLQALADAIYASDIRDQARFDEAMKTFREAYASIRPEATQSVPE